MHLKKIIAMLAASGAIAAAGMGVTGTAQASTPAANPTTATATPQDNPPLPSFIYGFYSSEQLCELYGAAAIAANNAAGGTYRGDFCQDGWGIIGPWALWIYYD